MIDLTHESPKSLLTLSKLCCGQVVGEAAHQIVGMCSVTHQQPGHLAFIGTDKLIRQLDLDSGCAYIVKPGYRDRIKTGILHDNPTQAYRLILEQLTIMPKPSIAKSAMIADSAVIGQGVSIGEQVIIEAGVKIADQCVIQANSVIKQNVKIGKKTVVGHHVTLHHDCVIGESCVLADGVVIGAQGFGFSFEGGGWQAIPQIGKVKIGNFVHIGANTCIDRGAIEDTQIGHHVIIDNLVHIAHNVKIGDGTAMAACVGIAGSTTIGKHCLLAGQVGVAGHLTICDGVQVNGGAKVLQSIKSPGVYAGSLTVMPANKWNKIAVYIKRIESLFKREK